MAMKGSFSGKRGNLMIFIWLALPRIKRIKKAIPFGGAWRRDGSRAWKKGTN